MDPNATYEALLLAITEGETEDAREHAQNLLNWINRGGFYPLGYLPRFVNANIHKAINAPVQNIPAGWEHVD